MPFLCHKIALTCELSLPEIPADWVFSSQLFCPLTVVLEVFGKGVWLPWLDRPRVQSLFLVPFAFGRRDRSLSSSLLAGYPPTMTVPPAPPIPSVFNQRFPPTVLEGQCCPTPCLTHGTETVLCPPAPTSPIRLGDDKKFSSRRVC